MDEQLYRDLLEHAERASWRLAGLVDAGDVVHEAYLRVVKSGRQLTPALLHRAVNSVIADTIRRASRRPASLPLEEWAPDDGTDVEREALTALMADEILAALGDLASTAIAIAEGDSLNAVARLERRSKATWWRRVRSIRQTYLSSRGENRS
jgi:DNA-directed RNA polymerase specialized sigma24 family protein